MRPKTFRRKIRSQIFFSKALKSVFDAWRRIIGEEGITALWTGCGPTIGRAMVVNVCQLCCQTQAKEEIAKRTSGMISSMNADIKYSLYHIGYMAVEYEIERSVGPRV